jgi:muramoyltetrapeptide carboxypeptidase LdcA involved in peptidoglycan recycling
MGRGGRVTAGTSASAPIKPPRLKPGDTVAVVSTSWGGPSVFPHVFDRGVDVLRRVFGLEVRELPTARMAALDLGANPRQRADDLNEAFADPSIRAIVMSIGGVDSIRILEHLDPSLAAANPKILLGFSDSTTQLAYYNQAGLVTFNGPSVMAGIAQLEQFEGAVDHVLALLFEPRPSYDYLPFKDWTDGYPDWRDPSHAGEVGERRPHDGWRWLQGEGRVQGRLFGGCAETMEMMKGTRFWPEPEFWRDRILFLETSEDKPAPETVGYWLRNYGVQGVFDRVSGVLIGRARGYSNAEKAELDAMIVRLIAREFGATGLPIVTNLDFGHTDPQWILPLGVRAEIDADARSLRLLEPAVT